MRSYADQLPLETPFGGSAGDDDTQGSVNLDIEHGRDDWRPIDLGDAEPDPDEVPRRFVDGSNVHETVAWLRDPENGYPVPVLLAELGGVCIGADGRELRREFAIVERAVAMSVDPFPWHDIEPFAAALSEEGWRLVPARPPEAVEDDDSDSQPVPAYDFERAREQARVAVLHEMTSLEEVAWGNQPGTPTLIDGRLGRLDRCNIGRYDVVGVIKKQRADYLHPLGWKVIYDLQPGQRTPAFVVPSKHLQVVSWYLKLDGADGQLPNWGIIRVEVSQEQFDARGGDFRYADRMSAALLKIRCRGAAYARGPVSLEPIVRAEQSLKSLFSSIPALAQHFYRLSGI
jgi:hypothetical protein